MDQGCGFQVSGFRFQTPKFQISGFRVMCFDHGVSGSGLRVDHLVGGLF